MSRFSYVNGRYERSHNAKVHIEDRGYQFADSIYEVIACVSGHLVDESGHLDRLERSLRELSYDEPVSRDVLRFIMRQLLKKNRLKNASIYIQVSRGVAARDFVYTHLKPSLVVTLYPLSLGLTKRHRNGLRIKVTPDLRWGRRDIKTTGLLAQSMAKTQAKREGYDDAWMVDNEGFITEGSSNNAWIVKNNRLITRHVSSDILKGVTRNAILQLTDLNIEQRPFSLEEACHADEAFGTSATNFVMPVVEINDQAINKGKRGTVTAQLQQSYMDYMTSEYDAQFHWNYDD